MSDARRFQLSVLASVVVNCAALLLAAHLWHISPLPFPSPLPRIKLVQIETPPRPVPIVETQPVKAAVPKPHPRKPPPRKPHRPGARVKSSTPAPLAKPAGGSDAGAAAPAQAAPSALPVMTTERPSPHVAQIIKAPPPPIEIPTPSFTPSRIVAPPALHAVPAVQTTAAHGSAGTDTAGQGKGAGVGLGTGIGAGSGTSRDAGEPFGIGRGLAGDGGPRHVVYVLDISGSMTSRIGRADAEIRKALAGLRPDETFDIIAFNNDVQSFDPELVPATPETIHQASVFLSRLQVDDGTDTQAGMTAALSIPGVNEVILLTDGVPGLGITDPDSLADYVRHRNRNHARISCVGMVGKDQDGIDRTFEATGLLKQIARDSGGACEIVPLGYASP